METKQQFSLSWKNFHGNLSNGFSGLLGSGEFVDVTLAVEGQLLQAHKVVLSICSPYFKKMFQLNPCQHPIVVLRDISHRIMRDLLQFMYNGEVSVTQEDLTTFISTAESLQIKGLTNKLNDGDNSGDVSSPTKPNSLPIVSSPPQSTNLDYVDLFAEDMKRHSQDMQANRQKQLEALKRKSQEYNTAIEDYSYNTKYTDNMPPEKRTKLREKQILNRHKRIGGISVKNFETNPITNIFNNAAILQNFANTLQQERAENLVTNLNQNVVTDRRQSLSVVEDIKQETEDAEVVKEREEDQESERSPDSQMQVPETFQDMEQEVSDGRKLSLTSAAAAAIEEGHTIVTIPQREDGKKKYPQRSCKHCWREGRRRDTRFMCRQCAVPLCKTSCFQRHQTEDHISVL